MVACTQEKRLFAEIGAATPKRRGLAGQVRQHPRNRRLEPGRGQAMPKMAALLAAAHLPDPEPVPTVTYKSAGRLLIIGPLEQAERAAGLVSDVLDVTLFTQGRRRRAGAALPGARRPHRQPHGLAGRVRTEVVGQQPDRPGPVHALQCLRRRLSRKARSAWTTRSTWRKCASHRACVKACAVAGAIDFNREASALSERVRPGAGPARGAGIPPACAAAGLFPLPLGERPGLRKALATCSSCATWWANSKSRSSSTTSRSSAPTAATRPIGCNACIDVCSAEAIASDKSRQQIKVNPNLCVGCGACTTVCPTGALTYAYPRAADAGRENSGRCCRPTCRPAARRRCCCCTARSAGQALVRRGRPGGAAGRRPRACRPM